MASYFLLPIFLCSMAALTSTQGTRDTLFHDRVGGFTSDFIHRDSPLSPLYNPSLTRADLISGAYRRSFSRAYSMMKYINASSSDDGIDSPISSGVGDYIMKIYIGTPPVETIAIADTGSDLTWTQCRPCTHCYKQDAHIFNPTSSSSYKILSCQSTPCLALGHFDGSCSNQSTCLYRMRYGDGSLSKGDLSSETFMFGSSSGKMVSFPNVAFGCGHDNGGFFDKDTSGIIGLGGGPLSIVRQLKDTVNGKFSYCLVPTYKGTNVTSKIKFGSQAKVSGPGVVSTPLVRKDPHTFYYLTLESIKVGDHKCHINYQTHSNSKTKVVAANSSSAAKGIDMIIDSGTTLTYLPVTIYNKLESKLKSAIGAEPTAHPRGESHLCYKGSVGNLTIPTVTMSFRGADLELPPSNTFWEVHEGLVCSTLIPSDGLPIFGNLCQENFLIGYDLVSNTVSFKPTECTQQQ